MTTTSEKLLEILNQICEKFGIVMDENIYSLSELAQNLTNEIVVHTLIMNTIILFLYVIIGVILIKYYKKKNENDNIETRCKNLFDYFFPLSNKNKNDTMLAKKIERNSRFNINDYIIDTFIMIGILFVLLNLGIQSFSYVSEIIKAFTSPDMIVVDYFMKYYLQN